MQVYGDHLRPLRPREQLARLRAGAQSLRPETRIGLLLEAGELAQALLDFWFSEHGWDDDLEPGRLLMSLPMALAQEGNLPISFFEHLSALERLELPEKVWAKTPEGYAFYAVYPKQYFSAAQVLRPLGALLKVIGIRSIGTSLGCAVACGAGSGRAPLTVRPTGHPFHRELRLSPSMERALFESSEIDHFAVVDEGPGLSGSSFGAVAEELRRREVPYERIHFFPSHLNSPGPQGSPEIRQHWSHAQKHWHPFEPRVLAGWFEDVTGPARAPLEDISGGAWRNLVFSKKSDWPAVDTMKERLKFLLQTKRGTWFFKFAGLGRFGEEKRARAEALADAGFTLRPAGLRHGFLAEPWRVDAKPLSLRPLGRMQFIHRLAEYLCFRANAFPAKPWQGASVKTLFEMARTNVSERFGRAAAQKLEPWWAELDELGKEARPIHTDGRLQAWEWLVLDDGRLVKTDALDHCCAHDLIGCQDIGWDLAGAGVELRLSDAERRELEERVARELGRRPSPAHRSFYEICYLAFHLGWHTLAAQSAQATDRLGLEQSAGRYAERLRRALSL